MKKITAMLLACMMIGCTFAACGKTDDDSSSKKSTSASTEASTGTDSTDDTTEAQSTEADTTEAKTTEAAGSFEGGNLETLVLGKWEASKMVSEGVELTDLFGVPMYAVLHVEIKADGSVCISSVLDEDNAEQDGTWKVTGKDAITINALDDESGEYRDIEVKVKDENTLVMVEEDEDGVAEFHFRKVDKFTEFDLEKWQEEMQNQLGSLNFDDEDED